MKSIDHHAIAAAFGCAHALHAHVAEACRPSAFRDLASLEAAHGVGSHALKNCSHRRDFWMQLQPIAIAAQGEN